MSKENILNSKNSLNKLNKSNNIEEYMADDWYELLKDEFSKEYFIKIKESLKHQQYLPETDKIFEFTQKLRFRDVKVVFIGQDPYQRKGEASGIAFSTGERWTKLPNICRTFYRAIKMDYPEFIYKKTGNLIEWVEQGVLLLNDTLTVKEKLPGSHFYLQWNIFTNRIVELVSQKSKHVPFVLLGNRAREKTKYIDTKKHYVIEAVHPSHYHAEKFVQTHIFRKINIYLKKYGKEEIVW